MTTFEEQHEYDIPWTKEYSEDVDKIIKLLEKEYPLFFRQAEKGNCKCSIIMVIIHAINYARQIGLDKQKVKEAIENNIRDYLPKGKAIDKDKLLKELGL